MSRNREHKIEKYLDDRVTSLGGITRKWTSPGRDGVPDRIVILNSCVVFIEVKTADGKVSPVQEREHERLRACGANVYTLFGFESVDLFIEELKTSCLHQKIQ